MPRPARSFIALLAVLAFLSIGAVPALAAPVAWESVSLSLHDEGGTQILIVSGTLPDSVALPAQVELPVPKGSELSWSGEILGGPPAQDPAVQTATRTVGASDVYAFTLTKARIGQVEVLVPGSYAFDGSAYSARLSWTPVADVPEVTVDVRVPRAAEIVKPAEGAKLGPGPEGYAFYSRTFRDVRAGKPVTLAFTFTAPAPVAPTSGASDADAGAVPVLLGVVAAAIAVVVLTAASRRIRKGRAEGAALAEEVADAEPAVGEAEPDAATQRKTGKPALIIGFVVLAILGLVAVSMSTTRSTQDLGGRLTREFGQGDACTKASIALAEGADAEGIFAALESVQVIRAAVVPAERRLEVEFCDSQTSEQAIRASLEPLGVLVGAQGP
ncbi:MAG: hypothetical protein C0418_04660 [Coriobacteriaceae bacterium]|nr:hypothetical protein [Coriobacteriaceae bacterium]